MVTQELSEWKMQTPGKESLFGEVVCSENFDTNLWIDAKIPNSVVGSLYEAGKIDDIYFGKNMYELDGFKTEAKNHFAWNPMPQNSPYKNPIWYRTEFDIDDKSIENRWWIKFHGLNFRAEIWLNGKRIASEAGCAGTYRQYDLDITKWVHRYNKNVLAVKITAQRHDELGLTFVDWLPTPPDDSAGIWQRVELYSTGNVAIKEQFANPILTNDLKKADVNFSCKLVNNENEKFAGKLKVSLDEGDFVEIPIEIEKFDEQEIKLEKSLFDEGFELWYPHDVGKQPIYILVAELLDCNGEKIDRVEIEYAYRKIESKINEFGAREFWINGKKTLIRGAAYAPDLLLRQDFEKEEIETEYIRLMNFNAVRLEGFLGSDNFWNLCDKKGILVFAGWSCCTHWEKWEKWKQEDYVIAEESLKSQILRLRNHASFTAWFYGSDFPPLPKVEKIYLKILEEYAPNLVRISSAAKFPSVLTGESGVKMSGPYGFVPPAYWYNEEMNGVAHSFNTETCPESSLPRFESAVKFLPENEQFIGSPSWNFHCGVASFTDIEPTINGLEKRYGIGRNDFKKFLQVGQIMGYECWRAMYEAYGRNFPDGTGVFGWMLNASWGKTFWQLFDYYLTPTGGFYGSQKACEKLHCQYSYDDGKIWLLNFTEKDYENIPISISVYDKNSQLIYEEKFDKNVSAESKVEISKLKLSKIPNDFFILKLDYAEKSNVYWLTKAGDEFEKEHKQEKWYYRPLTKYADLSPILNFAKTELSVKTELSGDNLSKVLVKNIGKSFAAGVQLDFVDKNDDICYPVYFSENLLWLAPNEEKTISAKLPDNSKCSFTNLKLRAEALNSDVYDI